MCTCEVKTCAVHIVFWSHDLRPWKGGYFHTSTVIINHSSYYSSRYMLMRCNVFLCIYPSIHPTHIQVASCTTCVHYIHINCLPFPTVTCFDCVYVFYVMCYMSHTIVNLTVHIHILYAHSIHTPHTAYIRFSSTDWINEICSTHIFRNYFCFHQNSMAFFSFVRCDRCWLLLVQLLSIHGAHTCVSNLTHDGYSPL